MASLAVGPGPADAAEEPEAPQGDLPDGEWGWTTPLEAISDTGGPEGSRSGSFAATYQGDDPASDLVDRLQQPRLDMNAWERELLGTGEVDPGSAGTPAEVASRPATGSNA